MNKLTCQQIDSEFLVEQYVAGKLTGELQDRFEEHIAECVEHTRAVSLEKVLKRGVRDYARSELKSRIMNRVKKREDIRVLVLRFAAFLFLAVLAPLILYYQFGIFQKEKIPQLAVISDSVATPLASSALERKKMEISATEGAEKALKAPAKEIAAQPDSKGLGLTVPKPEPPMTKTEEKAAEALSSQIPVPMEQEDQSMVHQLDVADNKAKQVANSRRSLMVSTGTVSGTVKPTVLVFGSDNALHPKIGDKISSQIDQYEPEIRDCLKINQMGTGNLYDNLVIEFMILADGKTRSAKIIKTNIDLKESENCILEKINAWTFPMIDSEYRVQIQYRFKVDEG